VWQLSGGCWGGGQIPDNSDPGFIKGRVSTLSSHKPGSGNLQEGITETQIAGRPGFVGILRSDWRDKASVENRMVL